MGASAAAAEGQEAGGTGARGSEKLIEELLGRPQVIEKSALGRMLTTVAQAQDVRIIDWWWIGMPGITGVLGRLEVDPRAAGGVLQGLFGGDLRPEVTIFPRGLPKVDNLILEFRIGNASKG